MFVRYPGIWILYPRIAFSLASVMESDPSLVGLLSFHVQMRTENDLLTKIIIKDKKMQIVFIIVEIPDYSKAVNISQGRFNKYI